MNSRSQRLMIRLAAIVLCLSPSAGAAQKREGPADAKRPNVLFIAIDDLRDWVGYLGVHKLVQTPNLDRLAERGVRFTRSYCAAPVCNPSRTALLTGLRPFTSGVYDNGTDWRAAVPRDIATLPQHFKRHEYFVAGSGKIYHGSSRRVDEFDEYLEREGGTPQPPGDDRGVAGIAFAPLDCEDDDMPDYRIVSYALEQLGKKHDRPFFLACGLHKPHMPWSVPQEYFDMYPIDSIELPKVLENDLDDVPLAGVRMARPEWDHAAILQSGRWKEAVQAYLASISFADAMIGRLIDGLDQSAYKDNTIVVLWSDHGWHLGEKQHWRKFALWEEATRAPLIVVAPGVTKPGEVCERPVDFMSIYPTIADLCGLPIPDHVEGVSLRPLLENPGAKWERPAITTHLYKNHAVRTEQWRYIRYEDGSEELYDELKDPLEWTNLAGDSQYDAVKSALAKWLPERDEIPAKKSPSAKKAAKKKKTATDD